MSLNNIEQFREKLASGEPCLGCVISLNDPVVSEVAAAAAGYDFTWIDMEHAPLGTHMTLQHIMAVRGTNTFPLVRAPWNDRVILKQIRDLEPAGIIIPMIRTAEEAETAVAACKYPPRGFRGIGPKRGTEYGNIPFEEYVHQSEQNCMIILQIEHIDAVSHLDAILDVPGVDSICIGPSDLSASMGKIAHPEDQEVVAVIDAIVRKVKEHHLILGTASGDVEGWMKRGVDWIATGSDIGNMASHGRQSVQDFTKTLRRISAEEKP